MTGSLWFFQALGAAVLWGLGYALSDRLLKGGMTPSFTMVFISLITLPCFLALSGLRGEFRDGFALLRSGGTLGLVVVMALCIVGGNFLIMSSIVQKNATLSSLVEISYPLFTFLFAWILFRDVQLGWATAAGALLIFSGIAVIYFKG